ncbi:MAG: aminotransferase class V-fold PLP-dependent enzyme [Candidatus Bathyarchaeota archaeon]|nr:aminotransferase class V-fold PLP-dependent enzyme [Candidatus Bathyarchaeota archaeon]
MDLSHTRKDFPILQHMTYLNTAASGPMLKPVQDAVLGYWKSKEETQYSNLPDPLNPAAELINCNEHDIALVHRASQGVNIVAGLVQPKKGENIVLTDLSYPSSVYPWMGKQAEIKRIKNHDGVIDVADFEKTIDDNTKIVCLNRVEWTSGQRHDVKAISEIAHEHGALVLDDAFQAVGAVKVDVRHDDVDFLVFGGEKWLCSPCRAAVMYVKPELVELFMPDYRFYWRVYEGFKWTDAPWDKPIHDNIASWDHDLVKTAERFDPGCVAEDAQCGLDACLRYFNNLGIAEIQKQVFSLVDYLIECLEDLGVKVNTPKQSEMHAGIVTYTHDRYEDNVKSYAYLQKNGVNVAHRYTGGVGGIRVSPHFFNTEADIDELLRVQREALI